VLDQLLPFFVDTWINKPVNGAQTPETVFISHCALQKNDLKYPGSPNHSA